MLRVQKQSKKFGVKSLVMVIALLLIAGGGYMMLLVASPTIAPLVFTKPIDASTLAEPKIDSDRIVIPKIGVDIVYGKGKVALDNGAEWRHPDRGNPSTGGNFIIAAHRFTLAATPGETVRKSPFYNIDKLAIGDQIIIDYSGTRYAYQISQKFDVEPTQTEIEDASSEAKLTLYSCELDGSKSGRVVIIAKPLGAVTLLKS